MKNQMWFVVRVNINQSGTQSNSIQMYTDEKSAYKRFWNILAADVDNENYIYELVQIIRDDSICIASQVFDNRTTPDAEE